MKRRWLFFIFIFFAALLWALIFSGHRTDTGAGIRSREKAKEESAFDFAGEKITYDVKLGRVNLGAAVFHYAAKTLLDGEEVNLVTFNTKVARFDDLEKIYSDSRTFLPVRVERDIRAWPTQEKITEIYDQKNFSVTISKVKGTKEEKILIRKDGVIHNAILLPFQVRREPGLVRGWTLQVRLPTREFLIRLASVEDVKVPAGIFKAYRFESKPEKFHIWISADSRRIPVKIIGSGPLGYTLVMKHYSPGK